MALLIDPVSIQAVRVMVCDDEPRPNAGERGDDPGSDQRTETMVQQLYATGLTLQRCLDGNITDDQRVRLEQAIDVLDGVIHELGTQQQEQRRTTATHRSGVDPGGFRRY